MSWLFEDYEKTLKNRKVEKIDIKNLKLHIKYLQHERIIHLMVTLTVGLATLMVYLFIFLTSEMYLLVAALLLSCLFVAYLFYYRKLENTVQNWYGLVEKYYGLGYDDRDE